MRSDVTPNRVVRGRVSSWLVTYDRHGCETARARIDTVDIPRVRTKHWRWSASPDGGGYLVANNTAPWLYLHRFLTGARRGQEVDHKNGNGLDCRRSNMRIVPLGANAQNVKKASATGHRNVYRRGKRYRVQAGTYTKGTVVSGGTFDTLDEAIEAARALRAKLFPYVNEARHETPMRKRQKRGHVPPI